jgi:hypothetical protein
MSVARIVIACLVLAAAGCGGDAEQQVGELMTDLRQVQESGDAERACKEVYVVREPGRPVESEGEEGGEAEGERAACEPAFEQAVRQRRAGLKRLDTDLTRVTVRGDEGLAVLHTAATRADGSTFERDVPYDVVHTEDGWRVAISPEH